MPVTFLTDEDKQELQDSIDNLTDQVDGVEQSISGNIWRDEVYAHGTQQSNKAVHDFDVDGVAGNVYSVRVNSMTYTNTKLKVVYFMGADGSYQTAVPAVTIGALYKVTATADFVKIRFYFTYETYPADNLVSVSFGYQTASFDSKINALSERVGELEENGVAPISILCGYTENVYCIGDSLTAGYVKIANSAYLSHYSYPYFLSKLMNTAVVTYAQAGDTASQAWTRWQTQIANITDSLVVVWLGTNPTLTNTVSTDCAGDDPAAYADTDTGNYGRIIKTLLDNGNKVVLAHIFTSHNPTIVATANTTITSLGDRFACKVIELSSGDIEELNNEKYHTAEDGTRDVTHLSCMGYSYVANVFFGKMNRLAADDPQWFCIRKNKA